MDASEFRNALIEQDCPASHIAYVTGLDLATARLFLHGDHSSLSESELDSILNMQVSDEHQQLKEFNTQSVIIDGLGDALGKHTVGFLYERRDGTLGIATGVLIELGEREFVATARHVVHPTSMLQFMGSNMGQFTCNLSKEGAITEVRGGSNLEPIGHGRHDAYDVGYFEVAQGASQQLGRTPIGLADIGVGVPQYGRNTFIIGFPESYFQIRKVEGNVREFGIGSITFPTPLLDPSEWPEVPEGARDSDPQADFFVPYDITREKVARLSQKNDRPLPAVDLPTNLPNAHGISGGGFWQGSDPQDGLWKPCNYRLIGIQGSWSDERKYLRATRSVHLLDLLRQKCPDLKTDIDQHLSTGEEMQ